MVVLHRSIRVTSSRPGCRKSSSDWSSGSHRRRSEAASTAAVVEEKARTAVTRSGLCGTKRTRAVVITPSVPSLPQSRAPRSYPVLSLIKPPMWETTSPVPSTASNPTSCALVEPWRSTWRPPALVAMVPPMVALSRLARSTPYSQPAASAAAWTTATVDPAPAESCPPNGSTSATPPRRRRLSTTSPPRGTPPPTSPVLPPWGTRATPSSLHATTTAAVSATSFGRTTALGWPRKRPVQSMEYDATTSGSRRTFEGPTTSRSSSSRTLATAPSSHLSPRSDPDGERKIIWGQIVDSGLFARRTGSCRHMAKRPASTSGHPRRCRAPCAN